MCSARRACVFHSIADAADMAAAAFNSIDRKGAIGLAAFVTAGLAHLDRAFPPMVRATLKNLDPAELNAQFGRYVNLPNYEPRQLRRLAGQALTLALLMEASPEKYMVDEEEDET